MAKQKRWNFNTVKRRLTKAVNTTLPKVIANRYKNHFIRSFRTSGFEDEKVEKWQKRKKSSRTKQDRRTGKSRKLLVQTANLKGSIRVFHASRRIARIGTNVKYAPFHNRGTRHLPKRKFIGESAVVRRWIAQRISTEITRAFETGKRPKKK